jgi:hypothetical protein
MLVLSAAYCPLACGYPLFPAAAAPMTTVSRRSRSGTQGPITAVQNLPCPQRLLLRVALARRPTAHHPSYCCGGATEYVSRRPVAGRRVGMRHSCPQREARHGGAGLVFAAADGECW